jgi:integrase
MPDRALQRGARLATLTCALWCALESSMSPDQAKVLIDQWLIAKLDEDADLRDLPPGRDHFIAIFRQTEPWRADEHVRTLDQGQFAELIKHDPAAMTLYGPGETAAKALTDSDIAKRGFFKSIESAPERLVFDEDVVARPLVAELLTTAGIAVDEESPGFKAAVRFMLRAQQDLLLAHIDRNQAGWRRWSNDDPAEGLISRLRAPGESAPAPTTPGPTPPPTSSDVLVEDAAEAYIAESVAGKVFKPGRGEEVRKAVKAFNGWVGRSTTFGEVSASMAGDYRQDMAFYPENAGKRPDYRDLSVPERIRVARVRADPRRITLTTLNGNYIDPLRGLWDWAQSTGKVTTNPFTGIKVKQSRKAARPSKRRDDFTLEQLRTLFSAPLFTGSAGDQGQRLYRPGEHRVDDWRYWLPTMGLFTGARLNELCGLRLADFNIRDGVDYIHIRAVAEGQSTKTTAANRLVPVHSELVALGLIERVGDLSRRGEERLFPNLRPGPRNYMSDRPSKFFGNLIDRMLGDHAPVVFHSFRHTFISALRRAEVPRDVRTALVGHDDAESIRTETHDTYGEEAFQRLSKAVEAVGWPGLDLSRLKLIAPKARMIGSPITGV